MATFFIEVDRRKTPMEECRCYLMALEQTLGSRVNELQWRDANLLKEIPQEIPAKTGIYFWRSKGKEVGRFNGKCNLLYVGIGYKRDLRRSPNDQFTYRGYPEWEKALLDKLSSSLEIASHYVEKDRCKALERSVLQSYRDAHWELPPGNKSFPRSSG